MTKEKKESNINIKVGLDEHKLPQAIHWISDDNPSGNNTNEAKAMLVSFFDKDHKDTFKLDIWTPEMQIVEMDRFIYQTLRGIADTYVKATGNKDLGNDMQRFVQYFGEQTKIIPKEG